MLQRAWHAAVVAGVCACLTACGDASPTKKADSSDRKVETEDLKVGTGTDTVDLGDKVFVHYTGWLDDNGKKGKKFDSSHDRGKPFEFTVGSGVIEGWSQGVIGMKVGGKRLLRIPAYLGYGSTGHPPDIPPNSDLIFEVEVLKIEK